MIVKRIRPSQDLKEELLKIKDKSGIIVSGIGSLEKATLRLADEKIVEVKGRGEFIELEEAEGRALADDIGAYPPGVPFFFRGERLDREKLDYLKRRKNALFNLVSGKICVIIE